DRRATDRQPPQHRQVEIVPGDGEALGTIAQMPRDMMQDADELGAGDSRRSRRHQRVVALVRIERAELLSEHRLIIDEEDGAAVDVIDQIEITAEMCVPGESLIV